MNDFASAHYVSFPFVFDLGAHKAETRHVTLTGPLRIDRIHVVADVDVTPWQEALYSTALWFNRVLPVTERWWKARSPRDVSEDLRLERICVDDVPQTLAVLRLSAFADMVEWNHLWLGAGELAIRVRNMGEQPLKFVVFLRGRTARPQPHGEQDVR
jgi:hypothetical protein